MGSSTITAEGALLALSCRFHPDFLIQFKSAIPSAARKWDGDRKVWLVDPLYGPNLQGVLKAVYDEDVELPTISGAYQPFRRTLDVRYIGTTKDKGGKERIASGYCDDDWSVVFPESVLRAWFGVPIKPGEEATLYGTLGLPEQADETAIRSAYRRLARQWHPDLCKEPGAKEQFILIKRAYDTLSDGLLRAKYDAGLLLERRQVYNRQYRDQTRDDKFGYRTPLRCGLITCEGVASLRLQVTKILRWDDIVQGGLVLATDWPRGAQFFVERWV